MGLHFGQFHSYFPSLPIEENMHIRCSLGEPQTQYSCRTGRVLAAVRKSVMAANRVLSIRVNQRLSSMARIGWIVPVRHQSLHVADFVHDLAVLVGKAVSIQVDWLIANRAGELTFF
jgi:hypothetical protein